LLVLFPTHSSSCITISARMNVANDIESGWPFSCGLSHTLGIAAALVDTVRGTVRGRGGINHLHMAFNFESYTMMRLWSFSGSSSGIQADCGVY